MEGQKQDLDNYFTENYEKYRKVYGSPTAARTALFKDYKYRSLQYQNYADAFNETFDDEGNIFLKFDDSSFCCSSKISCRTNIHKT